jgi:hypothetical protein
MTAFKGFLISIPFENEEETMQKLLLSAAGAVLASSMMVTPA